MNPVREAGISAAMLVAALLVSDFRPEPEGKEVLQTVVKTSPLADTALAPVYPT